MFNRSILMGRICNEPTLSTTSSGKSVTAFRVAVERAYRPKEGERETDFFNVRAWGKRAEFVCKYFSKGSMIMLEGERQQQRYTDKNGNSAIWDEIVADIIRFTGEKSNAAETGKQSDAENEIDCTPPDLPDDGGNDLDDYPF